MDRAFDRVRAERYRHIFIFLPDLPYVQYINSMDETLIVREWRRLAFEGEAEQNPDAFPVANQAEGGILRSGERPLRDQQPGQRGGRSDVLALSTRTQGGAACPDHGILLALGRNFAATLGVVAFSLTIGTLGYHYFGNISWVDGFLNAAMILTGMGPVDRMETTPGKLFAAFYALYSGLAFLTMVTVLLAPIYHRFIHRFNLEAEKPDEDDTHSPPSST